MKKILCAFLLVAAAVGAATIPTQTQTSSYAGTGTSTVSFSVNSSGVCTYSASRVSTSSGTPPPSSGFYDGGCYVRLVSGNGVSTGTTVVQIASHGDPTTASGTYGSTIAAGQWFWIMCRTLDGSTTVNGPQQSWVQYGQDTITLAGTNTKPYAIRITTYAAGTTTPVLTTTDIAAGAAYTISVPLPTGVTSIDWKYWVPGNMTDGVWVETSSPSTGTSVTGGSGVGTPNTTTTINAPANVPGSGSTTTGGGAIWNANNAGLTTTLATTLDKQTYREGVDKITKALAGGLNVTASVDMSATNSKLDQLHTDLTDGTGYSGTTFSSAGYDTTTYVPTSATVSAAAALLPTSPVAGILPTSITPTSHLLFDVTMPTILGHTGTTYHVDADMSPYSTSVTFLRNLALAALSILFFFLVVKTIRGAFAG